MRLIYRGREVGSTYSYALLAVSRATYDEIRQKMLDAGYEHQFITDSDGVVRLNMKGIALVAEDEKPGFDLDVEEG